MNDIERAVEAIHVPWVCSMGEKRTRHPGRNPMSEREGAEVRVCLRLAARLEDDLRLQGPKPSWDFTAGEMASKAETARLLRSAAALLTAQPEDVGEADVVEWANEETAGLMHVILQCDGEEHDEGSCECALAIREALIRARHPTKEAENV